MTLELRSCDSRRMTDHDALYHRLFSRPLMVEHLVRAFVPEAMAAGLQFDQMERVNAKAHAEALDGETTSPRGRCGLAPAD